MSAWVRRVYSAHPSPSFSSPDPRGRTRRGILGRGQLLRVAGGHRTAWAISNLTALIDRAVVFVLGVVHQFAPNLSFPRLLLQSESCFCVMCRRACFRRNDLLLVHFHTIRGFFVFVLKIVYALAECFL